MVRLVKSNSESQLAPPRGETTEPRSRRWLRFPLLLVFAVFFVGSGWFSYRVAAATQRVFTDNTTGGSPILQGKKVKDEDLARINILLIGVGGENHDGGDLADTIQLVSIDPRAKQVAMLSLPRDLYVQVPDSFNRTKINEIHSIGEESDVEGGGGALMKQVVKDVTCQDVHYFARVDFAGFVQIIDSVGGVDINVREHLYDPYYPRGYGYQVLNVPAGPQHMDGELALKYARSRETTTDFDRSRRQQEVLLAVRDKATSLGYLTNPAKVSNMIEILGNHVKTDLSLGEVQRLTKIVRDIPATNVTSRVVDSGESGLLYDGTGPGGAYVLLPVDGDYSGICSYAEELIHGAAVRTEAAKVELLNGSGVEGLARTESAELVTAGVVVSGTGNAPAQAQATTIYDYTDGAKPATVELLEKRYGVKAVKQPGGAPGIDIRVVIGSDHRSTNRGAR